MRIKIRSLVLEMILVLITCSFHANAQWIHQPTLPQGTLPTRAELLSSGISIVDPAIPDSLKNHGLAPGDIVENVKYGIQAVGWSQNQTSPYFIAVTIRPTPAKTNEHLYTVTVNWGYSELAEPGPSNEMGSNEQLSRSLTIFNSDYKILLGSVNDLTQRAATCLQQKVFRNYKYPERDPALMEMN